MNQHYYSENPLSEIHEKVFQYNINGLTLKLTAVTGVFAYANKVDRASELLIKNYYPSGDSLLDLGCGYGAIGLSIKALYPGLSVTMTDINSRAVEYARVNAANNGIAAEIFQSDLFSSLNGRTFSDIISNPPIAAGKKLNLRLIEESFEHLHSGGCLWLVAFHNKGGETLKKAMQSRYGNVSDVEKSGGIRVYRSLKA